MRLCLQIFLITLLQLYVEGTRSGCPLSSYSITDYTVEGSISLGVIGPVNTISSKLVLRFTTRPLPPKCDLFRRDLYKSILTFLFAMGEVNGNPELLPNITLGFHMLDSCFNEASALQATFQVMSGDGNSAPNYKCGHQRRVPAIIGDPLSSPSLTMARILGLWRVPQVSYGASHPSLSDKFAFPAFLRTIVSIESQPYALLEICKRFGWNWIGILASSTDYGTDGGIAIKAEATKSGICIAFYETINIGSTINRIPKIIDTVKLSTATVIILFISPPEASAVFIEVLQQNITGKVWLGVEAWITSPVILQPDFWKQLDGTIGIARSKKSLPNFSKFLQNLHLDKYPKMLSIRQFWEMIFNCKWLAADSNSSSPGASTGSGSCTGLERIITDDAREYNDPTSQSVYMAHNALYAVAHALHNLMSCRPGEGPFTWRTCADPSGFQPWQLLHYLRRVHFVNTAGEEIRFNTNGDIVGYFDILNWQLGASNVGQHVTVGTFNNYMMDGQKLYINESLIQWAGGQAKVPRSVCSESCPPGHRKALQRGQPVCCFICVLCPDGAISNQTDSIDCTYCPEDQWPNSKRDRCLPRVIEYLSYHETLGIVLAAVSVVFSLLTVMVLCVYLRFQNTIIVKANNRGLSYLLLLSLTFCFLCSLTFIGRPTNVTCTIRQSLFGITFSLCISCILAKTVIVLIAFKATKPGSSLRRWVGSQTAILVVLLSTLVQVIIVLLWLVLFPPFLEHNTYHMAGMILLECNEGSITMFYCSLGYMGCLALLSFTVAFLARTLPDNFNEAKYITFSMLTFLSVWLSFIPAYLSTKGKNVVAVEVFAILLSSAGLLTCIFCPKCYIILLRPSMNNREYLMSSKMK